MADINLDTITITEARKRFLEGALTPSELVSHYLERIKERDSEVGAYLEVFDDLREEAEKADTVIKEQGDASPVLTGIPIALKDNILVKGKKTTAASKILENYVATYDATIVTKLKEAGALFIGHTNMDEFAMGSSTENSAFGTTKNPVDTSRVPGGSSGGSAAAVAMGGALAAIGTDTGGSIRQPASFCGVVGLKTTYGRVSRAGLVAMGSSLDQAGPLTRSVEDAQIIFDVLKGEDPLDATTITEETYPKREQKDTYTIGVPRAFLSEGLDPDVLEAFEASLKDLEAQGHRVVDVDLPHISYALASYYVVMPAEVSSNLARYDGVRFGLKKEGDTLLDTYKKTRHEGFGAEVRRRILLGTYVLSAGYYDSYYGKAQIVKKKITDECNEAFKNVDVIMTPTTPSPAFKIGEKSDPLSMYLQDIFTVPANMTGMPAISVPKGTVSRDGTELPVGIQAIAPHAAENILFDIGAAIQGQ